MEKNCALNRKSSLALFSKPFISFPRSKIDPKKTHWQRSYCLVRFLITYGRIPPWLKYANSTCKMPPRQNHNIDDKSEGTWIVTSVYLGVEAGFACESLASVGCDRDVLSRPNLADVAREINGESFVSRQPESFSVLAFLEAQRNDSHSNQVASVNPLKALRNHRFHSLPAKTVLPDCFHCNPFISFFNEI